MRKMFTLRGECFFYRARHVDPYVAILMKGIQSYGEKLFYNQ